MALLAAGDIKSHRSIAGRCSVHIAAGVAPGFGSLGTTLRSLGAVDGTVDISPNQEIVKLQSSSLTGSYAVLETGVDYQVSMNLQEFDIWNIALALSYNGAAVTASTALVMDDNNRSSLRGLRVRHNGAKDEAGDPVSVADFEFWKVKIVSNGGVSFDRSGAAMLPIVAHCLHNGDDEVGRFVHQITADKVTDRDYE